MSRLGHARGSTAAATWPGQRSGNEATLTDDQHLWACALEVQRQHGDGAPAFVAEQIGALVIAGDTAGVDRWKAIAACMDALARPAGVLH